VASGELGADVAPMLSAADVALYRAKQQGRNRVAITREPVPAALPPIVDRRRPGRARAAAPVSAS
jgi:hypothetical protein